jgi:hypothetical protein
MKTITKTFILLSAIALTSCGQGSKKDDGQPAVAEKYCGQEISGYEVMDLKALGNNYKYTEEDNKLHNDLAAEVNKQFNDTVKVELFFTQRTPEIISMYVMAPDDKAIVEKVSCYIMQNDFNGRLPKTRKLLFYTPKHNTLVAAIKTKE